MATDPVPITPVIPIVPIPIGPVITTPVALSPANPTTHTTAPTSNVSVTVPNTTGQVTFSLVVTDNLGAKSQPATVTVTIQGEPVARITAAPNPVAAGAPIQLSGANSQSAGTGSIATYTFSLITPT
jgi:hypothetical protein